jgi:hypothetical protein
MDLYIYSPIRLHGVLYNYLRTGTTLPLLFDIVAGSKSGGYLRLGFAHSLNVWNV